MRKLVYYALFYSAIIVGQQTNSVETPLYDLDVPNSPAFILLDESPSVIQRPNSTRAFGLSLLQDVTEDGVLNNFALEATPFWMIKDKDRNAYNFYGIDENKKQNYFSKLKLASISAAYVKDKDSIVNLSVGARATIFEIKRPEDIDAYVDTYNQIYSLLQKTQKYVTQYRNEVEGDPTPDKFDTTEEYTAALKAYRLARTKYVNQKLKENAANTGQTEKMQEIINRKPILAVDLAIAYNHRFSSNEFNDNDFGRFGVWSTVAFSLFPDKNASNYNSVNIYGFTRYLEDGSFNGLMPLNSDDRFNAFDLGIKGELEFDKLIIGYEYINRSGDLEGYRSAGNIRYQIYNDFYITGTFGNNFEEQDDLITLFGIQWGLNHPLQSLFVSK